MRPTRRVAVIGGLGGVVLLALGIAVAFDWQTGSWTLVVVLSILLAITLVVAIRSLRRAHEFLQSTALANQQLQAEIEQRQRVEEQLRESEERLQIVFDSATGVSVIATDMNGIINFFSKGAEQILQYSAEEMVGKVSPGVFHDPAEVEARSAELTKRLGYEVSGFETFIAIPKRKGKERREWSYLCKDGTRKTVDLTVTVQRRAGKITGYLGTAVDRATDITGYLGTAVDITARKEMESVLEETVRSEKAARALLESAGSIARLGHWEVTLPNRLIWSDVIYAIHEIEPGTPITLDMGISYYEPDDQQRIREYLKKSAETGEAFEFEMRLNTARGHKVWIHCRSQAIFNDAGIPIGFHGVLQDVDARHKASELLAERNQQLELATREALAQTRAKADFLANMSHEIRTPLNAIIGMSDLLHDTITSDRQREFVETIRTSGDVLLTLINDILDFSKIESGQLGLEHIPIDLHECVESALDLIAAAASSKKLDLLYWIDPAVPAYILGDPTRLRQIFVNLINNAVKFTERGEVLVRVTRSAGQPKHLRFMVHDTGIGIPADRVDRLFHAFSQVDASTTRRYGGTGLGLAICHRLVEIMGGRIWVESEHGKGADFIFEIPCDVAEATTPTIYQRGANRDLSGLRVLLVDDNATNLWILHEQTEAWGMQSRETASPVEALEWIRRGDPFDLAILDGLMPEMNGYQLLEKLREHEHTRQLPVIMLTSRADAQAPPAARPDGVSELSKPVKPAALFEIVNQLVLGHGSTRAIEPDMTDHGLAAECPLKILVAEDNPVNQRVITLLLERFGYTAQIVANGLEVLAVLKDASFDVILLDIQMPEMDGFTVARELSHLYPRDHRPRMIALTADASDDDRELCLAAGMDDYLSKPIRSQRLARALRQAFAELRRGE